MIENEDKSYLENVKKVVEMAHDELINDPFSADVGIDQKNRLSLDNNDNPQTIQPQMSETPAQYKKVSEKRYVNSTL